MVHVQDVGLEEFIVQAKKKGVILYGAGRSAQNCLEIYNLENELYALCDGDLNKIGQQYVFRDKKYYVQDILEIAATLRSTESPIILVSTTIYAVEILEKIDSISALDGVECYFHALLRNHYSGKEKIVFSHGREKIPKIIHYCWFGGTPIPDHLQKYMDTWKKTNPDFEIIRHDENNYDVSKNRYMLEAYENKAWGFVPDYARLDIIYNEGGVYLDTDVELFRSLKPLLNDDVFFGFGDNEVINLGNGFGASRYSKIIKDMRDYYDNCRFVNNDGTINRTPCPLYQAPIFKKYGFQPHRNRLQRKGGMVIYPNFVLSPFGTGAIQNNEMDTKDSFAAHHDERSWFTKDEMICVSKMNKILIERVKLKVGNE